MDDVITTNIDINANVGRVWDLVSEPGWWINNGRLGGHRVERRGDECSVHDPDLGAFSVGVVALEPPRRAVFTWHPGGDAVPRTTVEFTLQPQDGGTVRVTVVESGFTAMSADQHARNYGANVSGWQEELRLALAQLEGRAGARS